MLELVKTIFIVSAVTLVVWLYAEAESLSERSQDARVLLPPGEVGGQPYALRSEAFNGQVQLDLRGTRKAIDEARIQLEEALRLTPSALGLPIEDTVAEIDLAAAIERYEPIANTGVRVVSVSPAKIRVELRLLVEIDVPIEGVVPNVETEGDPTVSPRTARVILPEAVAASGTPAFRVIARVTERDLPETPPGQAASVGANVAIDDSSPEVQALRDQGLLRLIAPTRATVSFTPRSTLDSVELDAVPVWIAMIPPDAGNYTVRVDESDQVLRATIRGPRVEIERIRSGELRVVALVSLESRDLIAGTASRDVGWFVLREGAPRKLPNGVTVEAPKTSVDLAITPTPAGPATPTGE